MKYLTLFMSVALFFCGCGNDDNPQPVQDSRSFHMGFTPFPSDFTQEALDLAYDQIRDHGDMILHHLDDGIPWDEAYNNTDYPTAVQTNLDNRKAKIPIGHKLIVTTTPTKQDRKTLAGYWNDESNGELPDFWAQKTFNDPEVITAFINHCRRMIDFFNPDYFAYGIEINASFEIGSDELDRYLVLADTTYHTLKSDYPNLPIFLTFQTQAFDRTRQQMLDLTQQMLPYSDYVALSHYPYWLLETNNTEANPADLPTDWIKSFRDLAPQKPFAISETGYAADDVILNDFGVNIQASAEWQRQFVELYLPELHQLDAEFVMWFIVQDYDKVWEVFEQNGLGEELKIWKDTGLFDGEGNARPGLQEWDQWLNLPKN